MQLRLTLFYTGFCLLHVFFDVNYFTSEVHIVVQL